MWGRSPLGENELELICMGEGPVHGFPLCLSSSLEKGCYKDINIIVYETDCIIIRSRVVPTHFTDGEPYSFALGSPGAKGTFRKLCLGCWETQEPPRGGRGGRSRSSQEGPLGTVLPTCPHSILP